MKFRNTAAGLLILLFFPLHTTGKEGAGLSGGHGRPNFVWIVSEDNSKHYLQLFDPGGIATPNIAEMAVRGILYTRAFCNAPVCSVARSTLISGCYAPRTGTQYHRRSAYVPMPEGIRMFPAYLREAGYYTTNQSKEDYNYVKSKGTWDDSSPSAHWSHRERGQPFFHMESHAESHESCLHFGADLPERYKPVTDPEEVPLSPWHPDTRLFRFTAAYYRDRILSIDTIVGRVIRELEEEGILEDTFVFYFSDNGGTLPGSKGYLYETGLHIPLVVRVPEHFRDLVNIPDGTRSEEFVSFVDFGPTLLELAGIGVPPGMDGKAFLRTGPSDSAVEPAEVTYGYADRFDEKIDLVRTVRKGNLKYMRSYQPFNADGLQNNYRYNCSAFVQWRELFRQGALNAVQRRFFECREPEALFDLSVDPDETRNLAGDPRYSKSLKEMRMLLSGWARGMPDLSFFPEPVLRAVAFSDPVRFGQENRERIGELIGIADLELMPFEVARPAIGEALRSGDPMKQYWGLIVCSTFAKQADPFFPEARELLHHPDLLVRTRAAEFLGIAAAADPVPVLTKALGESNDASEALLILNTVVMLRDQLGYRFNPEEMKMASGILKDPEVRRRMEYLGIGPDERKKP